MPIQPRSFLNSVFENGDIPVQENFWDVFASFIHQTEDGLLIFDAPDLTKRLGIGQNFAPIAPLGIKATGTSEKLISFHNTDGLAKWGFVQRPGNNTAGFTILQATSSGNVARIFIDEATGKVGVNTVAPRTVLDINETNSGGATKLTIRNTAAIAVQPGWGVGHVHDGAVSEKNGAFSIFEESGTIGSPGTERLTILREFGFVGINHLYPETKLHVARDLGELGASTALLPNTGIAEFGPIEQSVLLDAYGVQSRSATFPAGGGTPLFAASTLKLQELGGDIIIHGLRTIPTGQKIIIENSGRVGIGTITPVEQLQVGGRINIGDSTNAAVAGSMKWDGTDFFGFDGTNWVSLTGGLGFWTSPATDHITYNATNAKVGIGVTDPASALDLLDNTSVNSGTTAAVIKTTAATTGASSSDVRLALDISATGTWSTSTNAKNIGLYVSEVSGQAASNVNLAAVFNGNVVVGAITPTADMIGTEGVNVLALQNGAPPTSPIGATTNGGVQLYSASDPTGVSVFNIMNGNGNNISLFRHAALVNASLGSTVDTTYGTEEMEVINNLRLRLNEIEAVLQSFGLLA